MIKKSEEIFQKALKTSKTNPELSLLDFKRAIFLSPESNYYFERGEVYTQLGDLTSALLNYKKAYSLDRSNIIIKNIISNCYILEGLKFYREKDYISGIKRFTQSLTYNEENIIAYMHRGCCFLSTCIVNDNINKAFEDFEKCSKLNPYVNIIKGQYYLYVEKKLKLCKEEIDICYKNHSFLEVVKEFKKDFEKEIEKKKKEVKSLMKKKNYEIACEILNELTEFYPNDFLLFFQRGICCKEKHDYSSAIKDFLKCRTIKGRDEQTEFQLSECLYNLSLQFVQQKKYQEAKVYISEAIKWNDSYKYYLVRGDCHLYLSNHQEAYNDYKTANGKDDNDITRERLVHLHLNWGEILFNNAQFELAENEFTKSVSINKQNQQSYLMRSKVRFYLQKKEEAIEDIICAFIINDQNKNINNLVYQYLPQLIYNSKIKEFYRKKLFMEETNNNKGKRMDKQKEKYILNKDGTKKRNFVDRAFSLPSLGKKREGIKGKIKKRKSVKYLSKTQRIVNEKKQIRKRLKDTRNRISSVNSDIEKLKTSSSLSRMNQNKAATWGYSRIRN